MMPAPFPQMKTLSISSVLLLLLLLSSLQTTEIFAAEEEHVEQQKSETTFSPAEIKFYEEQVQPILAKHCYECHGKGEKLGGSLYLTHRSSVLEGGDTGPAVNLEAPEESVLLDAINYGDYEMPPSGKLPKEQIAILTRWVNAGAPWTPGEEERPESEYDSLEPKITEETRNHWSFRPVVRPQVPEIKDSSWAKKSHRSFHSGKAGRNMVWSLQAELTS